jgi:hypothetical protein
MWLVIDVVEVDEGGDVSTLMVLPFNFLTCRRERR